MVGAASVTYAFYVGLSGLYLVTGLLSVLIPAAITWFWFRKRSVVQDGEEMPCMGLGDLTSSPDFRRGRMSRIHLDGKYEAENAHARYSNVVRKTRRQF